MKSNGELSVSVKENPDRKKKTSGNKQGHNKLRSQIKNVVVRATTKYIGHGEICKSCSLQLKQIIAIKIILLIILNVNL